MNKTKKSGSWANLRALSINWKESTHSKIEKNVYVGETSNSFGESEATSCDKSWDDKTWDEKRLSKKSFSHSVLAQHGTAAQTHTNSCENTPRSRRRSVKRIIEKIGVASTTNNTDPDKSNASHRKVKTASKRDSFNFNLYMEAIENQLLDDEELAIWSIQVRFPNDDLRLYEGIFTVEIAPKLGKAGFLSAREINDISPNQPTINLVVDPLKGRMNHTEEDITEFGDTPRSPAVPRKMETAKATVHPITSFQPNQQKQQPPSSFATVFPAFTKLSPALQAKFKKMAQRRQSAPSIVIRGVLGKGIKHPYAGYNRDDTPVPYSPNVNSQRLSLKFGSTGATLNLSKRKYVMEGKVQLTTGMQTQDRYMFLFTDLLLIAKAKSGSNFKLKYRIRVCELWIASCLDDVSELPKSTDKSFVIGWPVTNCVATFSTPESKELWLSALLEKIHEEKEKESPKKLTLKIIKRDSSNKNQVKMITVTHRETARDVVRLAVKEFNCEDTDDNYNLWVMSRKEGSPYPLIGHENPHAIQLSHIRDVISSSGILQETEITSVARFENVIQPDVKDRCQFILRSSHQSPSGDIAQKRISRLKAKTPGSIFNWARKRSGQRNESSDSGHVSGNSVGSEGTTFFSSSPPSTSPPATPKLFSLPLGQVCENGVLPIPVASMLDILYRKAPYTTGIFRKSANAKTTRQLKRKLDEEADIDLDGESIHVIAALFKDFLRNIPDSLLDSLLYSKWTEASELENDEAKVNCFRSLLSNLDSCNRVLIRRLAIVLNRIASRSGRNNMTAYNLAVCISPSLLWPPGPALQTEAPIKVTEILQYFTERCQEVFDGLVPTDIDWPPEVDFKSDDDDNYEGDNETIANGTADGSVSPISDVQSSQKSMEQEHTIESREKEDDSDVNHFSRSRMARRQLQRRKPGSKTDSARLISLSQDSLDRLIDNSDVLNRVDMNLHGGIHPRGRHRGRDACSMSNDSGFTTLSGEEEEHPSSSLRRAAKESAIHTSASAGSNLNELAEQSMENVTIDCDDLRKLWSPSLLNISNGQIVEEDELCGVSDERHEMENSFSEFGRRQSQPDMPMRQISDGPQVSATSKRKGFHPLRGNSRLVEAITSPEIEYIESDDDEMTSPFRRKPPKYERLNDRSDYEPINNQGLAKEYMRQLREQSTDDVSENISKLVTPSESKRQYLSGVTVTVNDVRPQEIKQYRPVTLSIHGIPDSQTPTGPSSSNLDSSSIAYTNSPFFIGEEHSSGSTPDPDALSSSHEDVFKSWDSRPPLEESRIRSKTTSEIDETPMTAPLSRRFNSARSPRKIQLDLNISPPESPAEVMSPIQKLTENLQMIPDFRQHATPKIARRSVPDENLAFFGRKKASSVREGRNFSKSTLPSHYIKLQKTSDSPSTETSFKANLALESSQSSISNASKSSSRTSINDSSPTSPVAEGSFERDIRTRRPYSRRRHNIASKLGLKDAGDGTFSKSLPTSDWKSLKSDSISKRESSRESVKSDIPSGESRNNDVTNDVTSRLRQASNKLKETDIINMAGAVQTRIRELSSSPSDELKENSTSSQEFRPRAGSVKSKVTAFNHLITNAATPSPSSSPVEFIIRDNVEEFRVKRKNAVPTPYEKFTTSPPARSHLAGHVKTTTEPDRKKSEDSNRNGLVIRTTPDPEMRKSGNRRMKDSISVQIHVPDGKPHIGKVIHRKSPQPVSDDLIFTLSESFAFGNRKSPRNITPEDSPRDSPISVRRRRVENQTKRLSNPSPTIQPQTERRRHLSVDRYTPTKQRNNVHVTSWQVKHKTDHGELTPTRRPLNSHQKPSSFSAQLPPRDKNSNELPFIGFEKVFDSEESYV